MYFCDQTSGSDVLPVVGDDVGGRHLLALLAGQLAVRHRRQPDVGVETDLMAPVAGDHRAAARLRHVADQQAGPADRRRFVGEAFEELDQLGMAPVAVARQPHHLPGRPVDRQRLAAGEAAVGVVADRARLHRRPARSCGRTIPWPAFSDRPGCSSGGSGFGIQRAEVLRGRGAAGGHQQDQASDQHEGQGNVSHLQSHLGNRARRQF